MATSYTYLIAGGGMAAAAAIEGIRKIDPEGSIGLISAEPYKPYNRPPLSKGLWKGKPVDKIFRKIDQPAIDLHLGRWAKSLDPAGKLVVDDRSEEYRYDKLLLATGGTPRKLPFGEQHINYYRTFDDYERLKSMTGKGRRFGVIGGGFIGWEMAAALKMNDQEVVMIFPEHGIGALLFPHELSTFLNDYYRDQGVEVRPEDLVGGLEQRGDQIALMLKSGKEILVDHVVAGIGIVPNTQLAEEAGLKVDNGIFVDQFLRTSQADIYAAGDVANFYNPFLDKRLRVEHEDNANKMGRYAGINMAIQQLAGNEVEAQLVPYDYLPFFYSDLFDLGYEAIGNLNPQLQILEDWEEKFQKGVVYYLQAGRVRGVLLWNVWGQVDKARQLIAQPGPFNAQDLKGLLMQAAS